MKAAITIILVLFSFQINAQVVKKSKNSPFSHTKVFIEDQSNEFIPLRTFDQVEVAFNNESVKAEYLKAARLSFWLVMGKKGWKQYQGQTAEVRFYNESELVAVENIFIDNKEITFL